MKSDKLVTTVSVTTGVGIGVFWHVWSLHGFWWGLAYGIFWQVWVGYRLAVYLLGAG